MKTPRLRRLIHGKGFTLIELLVVIVIIGILAGLLLPVLKKVQYKAKRVQCFAETSGVDTGIKAYIMEYGKVPTRASDQGGADITYSSGLVSNVTGILRAIDGGWNTGHLLNPKKFVFLELPTRKSALSESGMVLDPWGNPYLIALDTNYDGKTEAFKSPSTPPVYSNAVSSITISLGINNVRNDPNTKAYDDCVTGESTP